MGRTAEHTKMSAMDGAVSETDLINRAAELIYC